MTVKRAKIPPVQRLIAPRRWKGKLPELKRAAGRGGCPSEEDSRTNLVVARINHLLAKEDASELLDGSVLRILPDTRAR